MQPPDATFTTTAPSFTVRLPRTASPSCRCPSGNESPKHAPAKTRIIASTHTYPSSFFLLLPFRPLPSDSSGSPFFLQDLRPLFSYSSSETKRSFRSDSSSSAVEPGESSPNQAPGQGFLPSAPSGRFCPGRRENRTLQSRQGRKTGRRASPPLRQSRQKRRPRAEKNSQNRLGQDGGSHARRRLQLYLLPRHGTLPFHPPGNGTAKSPGHDETISQGRKPRIGVFWRENGRKQQPSGAAGTDPEGRGRCFYDGSAPLPRRRAFPSRRQSARE